MILLSHKRLRKQGIQMRTKHLIQSLAGTEGIVVKEVFPEPEANAVVIVAHPTKREQCRCGLCHRKSKFYDRGRGIRRWRCSDIGSSKAKQKRRVLFARNMVSLLLLFHGRGMVHGAANALRTPLHGLPPTPPRLSFQNLCESSGTQ